MQPAAIAAQDAPSAGGGSIRDAGGNPAGSDLPDAGSPASPRASPAGISAGGNGAATVVLGPDDEAVYTNLTDMGNEIRVTINVTGLAGAGTAGGTAQFPPGGAVVATSFASVRSRPG